MLRSVMMCPTGVTISYSLNVKQNTISLLSASNMSRHNKRKMPEHFPFDLLMRSSPSSPSLSPPPKRSRISAASGGYNNNNDYLSPSPPMKSVAKIPEMPFSPPPQSSRTVLILNYSNLTNCDIIFIH